MRISSKQILVVSLTVTTKQTAKPAKAKLVLSDISEVAVTETALADGEIRRFICQ